MNIERIKLKVKERNAIFRLKKTLSAKFNLIDFRIFGSKARGEAIAGSDIDIMIELDKVNSQIRSKIYDIVFKINLENDTFISVTLFNKKEIEKGPMSESPIYKNILREGVLV